MTTCTDPIECFMHVYVAMENISGAAGGEENEPPKAYSLLVEIMYPSRACKRHIIVISN